MMDLLKKGFTLVEVNLAVFIMAGGILAMISLYSLGYRENRQSREDVASTACADDILNRLVLALSSTNITWKSWKNLPYVDGSQPRNGARTWKDYLITDVDKSDGRTSYWRVKANPISLAQSVFNSVASAVNSDITKDNLMPSLSAPSQPGVGNGQMTYALVAFRDAEDSPVMSIAVRVVRDRRWRSLMSQPIFFTEVHFHGNMREEENR